MAKTISCGGLSMPTVGLGTWEARDESEIETALNAALELGYRHIDTAAAYGNEGVIGRVLNQWISSGKLSRDDLFIVTKLPAPGIHRDRVEKYLTKSLELLGLNYVDLYLIHFPIGIVEKEGAVEYEKEDHKGIWQIMLGKILTSQAQELVLNLYEYFELEKRNGGPLEPLFSVQENMEKQVDAGRAKAIGVSNFTVNQISNILKFARIKPACNQVELHVFLQQPELVKFCQKNGLVVTAYSPLGNPGYNKFLKRVGAEERTDLVNVLTNPVVSEIAKKHNKTNAHVALRFLVQKNIVVIPKSVTPARLKSNFNLFDFSLDNEDMNKLEQLDIGEEARICDWRILPNVDQQPEYPFARK